MAHFGNPFIRLFDCFTNYGVDNKQRAYFAATIDIREIEAVAEFVDNTGNVHQDLALVTMKSRVIFHIIYPAKKLQTLHQGYSWNDN